MRKEDARACDRPNHEADVDHKVIVKMNWTKENLSNANLSVSFDFIVCWQWYTRRLRWPSTFVAQDASSIFNGDTINGDKAGENCDFFQKSTKSSG